PDVVRGELGQEREALDRHRRLGRQPRRRLQLAGDHVLRVGLGDLVGYHKEHCEHRDQDERRDPPPAATPAPRQVARPDAGARGVGGGLGWPSVLLSRLVRVHAYLGSLLLASTLVYTASSARPRPPSPPPGRQQAAGPL